MYPVRTRGANREFRLTPQLGLGTGRKVYTVLLQGTKK